MASGMQAMWAGVPLVRVKTATVDDTRLLMPLNSNDASCGFGCAPALLTLAASSSAAVTASRASVFIESFNTGNGSRLQRGGRLAGGMPGAPSVSGRLRRSRKHLLRNRALPRDRVMTRGHILAFIVPGIVIETSRL